MGDGLRRRHFVRLSALGVAAGVTGCGTPHSPGESPTETGTARAPQPTNTQPSGPNGNEATSVSGTVVSLAGDPIVEATVQAIVPGDGLVAETTTDGNGGFGLDTAGDPAWVRVSADGFHERTVAVSPDAGPTVELTARRRSVSLSFCGDVMFARRFYESPDADNAPHVRLSSSDRLADHRAIVRSVGPLLRSADITSVNLETPLTTTDWRHPTKVYAFASHPVVARVLADAGVDYTALGNNHAFDALEPGLEETLATLDEVGLAYSGAGRSSEAAWQPAFIERHGLTIGYLSCTTIVESRLDIDLSADTGEATTHTVTRDTPTGEESITFPGDIGAAEATDERLSQQVDSVTDRADVTVVQIHGGYDYQRHSIAKIRGLADAAISAGADLVVCHHPHVTGGVELRNGALVAWSLGNFVFDQTRWETFPSFVLTAHVDREGVKRAYLDPILLDGFVPKGVVGKPRADQLRRTAGLSSDEFTLGQRTFQYVRDRPPVTKTMERSFDGPGLYARERGWPRSVVEGIDAVRFGRDLLPTGTFDQPVVDARQRGEPLWWNPQATTGSRAVTYQENDAVQLARDAHHDEPAVLGVVARIPVSGPLTLVGRYRVGPDEDFGVRVSWYGGRSGSPITATHVSLEGANGDWTWLREELSPPREASHVDVAVRLSPPKATERVGTVDELRLIEWSDEATGGREYDHLRVDGPATVEFVANDIPGEPSEIAWPEQAETATHD